MQARKAEYQQYLQTPHWQATRKRRLAVSNYRCEFIWETGPFHPKHGGKRERCEATETLEVHHRHYDSKHREQDRDLQVLCRFHHCVQTILDTRCGLCNERVVYTDDDEAIEMVREAVEEVDGDIHKVQVDNIASYPLRQFCWECRDDLGVDD